MPIKQVKLPDIGEGISEGEIVEWLVKEGSYVKQFQPIVRVLTAKATVEIPSPYEGVLVRILAKPGDTVPVRAPIAEIEVPEAAPETTGTRRITAQVEAVETEKKGPQEALVKAPPRVRKLARELGVSLAEVKGTGPRGVITEADVLRHVEEAKGKVEVKPAPPPVEAVEARVERVPLKGVRRFMASRMVEAKARIPHAYIAEEVDFTELVRLRDSLKAEAESRGVKITLLPFIVKAVVKTLREYPLLNSSLDEERGEIIVKRYYNIGIAVDTPQGLVVPVIRNADAKGLFQIAREISELTNKAREGNLSLEDVKDGTFSITNIGSIGTVFGMAIINYPESAILGIHRIFDAPRYVEGEVKVRKVGYITLSFDHRFIEGAYATRFLVKLKTLLENPVMILASDEEFR
ncbi:MAG: dihydrolipoamide acetyltransferase family protein [Thermoprotei archaeon]|nr:dihydrolipoamide acetyltransferase family protein [Thermoprotei archaeon]